MNELKGAMEKELKEVTFSKERKQMVLDRTEHAGDISGADEAVSVLRHAGGNYFDMTGGANGKKRMLKAAVLLLLAGIVVPSSVYAAQKLYRMQVERELQDRCCD